MIKFVLRTTANGKKHLYLDDPSQENFIELWQADHARLLKLNTCALLYNDNDFVMRLFCIMNKSFFHVEVPMDSKIDFINSACVFQKNGEWNTVMFVSDGWIEQALGKREEMFMSYQYMVRHDYGYWIYFIRRCGTKLVLSHIVDTEAIVLGTYLNIKQGNDKLIAKRDDGYYDIFMPEAISPLKCVKDAFFEDKDGVFVWDSSKDAWKLYTSYRSIAKNAIYRVCDEGHSPKIEVYKISNGKLCLMLESYKWSWRSKPFGICVNNKIYLIDAKTECVDFENPKLTFWGKVKKTFKIK